MPSEMVGGNASRPIVLIIKNADIPQLKSELREVVLSEDTPSTAKDLLFQIYAKLSET